MRLKSLRLLYSALLLAALLACAGCVQVETTVRLEPDGSATVTEILGFSKELLEGSAEQTPETKDRGEEASLDAKPTGIAVHLTRDAAERRVKHLGDGARLVSHKIESDGQGWRRAICVYKLDDFRNFKYASPFLAYADYPENNYIQAHLEPVMKSIYWGEAGEVREYWRRGGELAVAFRPTQPAKIQPKTGDDEAAARITPDQAQRLRDLLPVFKDLFEGFRIRFTFESYAPIRSAAFGHRGHKSPAKTLDLLNFRWENVDNWNGLFLENEEIMIELLRGRLHAKEVVENCMRFPTNHSLPVFLAWGSRRTGLGLNEIDYTRLWDYRWKIRDEIYFAPSKPLFERYYAGKEIDLSIVKKEPKPEPADFAKIGWQEVEGGGAEDKKEAPAPKPDDGE